MFLFSVRADSGSMFPFLRFLHSSSPPPLLLSDTVFVLLHFDRCVEEEVNNDDEDEEKTQCGDCLRCRLDDTCTPNRKRNSQSVEFYFSFGASFPHQGGLCVLGGRGKCAVFAVFFALHVIVDDVHNRGHEMAPLRCSYFFLAQFVDGRRVFFLLLQFFSQACHAYLSAHLLYCSPPTQ